MSRNGLVAASSTPVQDHLVQLLAQGLHVGIGKAGVQRAHAVGVRTRAADGAVELGLADLAGWALGTVAAIAAITASWDGELKADVRTIEAHTHCGLLTGIERRHAIHHGLGKGWVLGWLTARGKHNGFLKELGLPLLPVGGVTARFRIKLMFRQVKPPLIMPMDSRLMPRSRARVNDAQTHRFPEFLQAPRLAACQAVLQAVKRMDWVCLGVMGAAGTGEAAPPSFVVCCDKAAHARISRTTSP